ncbi:MAG: hypothetical protein PHU04_05815 [Candidatus Peribacteraceae bacterium]|nr:hypothetical protein [Candidatus Peribacteraceae bacterium]
MTSAKGKTGVTIPNDVRTAHPELVQLILDSESMNNEERQYWVNILPVMTPAQVQNLRDILENEKRQLATIDRKYAKEIGAIGEQQLLKKIQQARRERRQERSSHEESTEQEEQEEQQNILRKISEL